MGGFSFLQSFVKPFYFRRHRRENTQAFQFALKLIDFDEIVFARDLSQHRRPTQ